MGSAAKAKGSGAERDVVKYLKQWFPYVDRRLAGATLDKGDISGIPGVTIEIRELSQELLCFGWVCLKHVLSMCLCYLCFHSKQAHSHCMCIIISREI